MNLKSTENKLSLLSIAIYLTSLCFAGFYYGDYQRPYGEASIHLLMIGWLGIISGHFSWFANPLLFIAYLYQTKKPKLSLILALASILLAMSFLFYDNIMTDEGGHTDRITAYGLGYYLWNLSIAVFIFGRIHYFINKLPPDMFRYKQLIVSVQTLIIIASAIIFSIHYFCVESSHYKLLRDRAAFFNDNCSKAKNIFYEKASNVKSIYFGPYEASEGFGYLNSALIEFYEVDSNKVNGKPYLRYTFANRFKGEEVDELKSEYSVVTKILTEHLRKELAIGGSTMSVVNNKDNKVIATCTIFSSNARGDVNDKSCGDRGKFLIQALNLTKRFPSSYDNK